MDVFFFRVEGFIGSVSGWLNAFMVVAMMLNCFRYSHFHTINAVFVLFFFANYVSV